MHLFTPAQRSATRRWASAQVLLTATLVVYLGLGGSAMTQQHAQTLRFFFPMPTTRTITTETTTTLTAKVLLHGSRDRDQRLAAEMDMLMMRLVALRARVKHLTKDMDLTVRST